jgi:NAD(P)-dependent dehydrogenase (short-subunit alcohol dehydrogenase family)
MNLTGKVAVVTGGGGGLGEAEVLALAKAGADVAVVEPSAEKARPVAERVAAATGRKVLPFACDVSKPAQTEALAAAVAERLGGWHIVVNNAAVYYDRMVSMTMTEEQWDRVFDVNVKGYWNVARAAYPHMKRAGGGKVVNIASITVHGILPEMLAYVSSKGAIVAFTRALAREWGPDNICVNTIAPGAFATDAEKVHPDQVGYNKFIIDRQSLKRRGQPSDLANAVVFLSAAESDFITGAMLTVDGGWAMY